MSLPPGPELPALAQAVAYHRDPLGVLRRARARYGPVFTLRITDPVVFVADPAAVEPLLRAVLPLVPRLQPVWPRTERMVVRGTVLVPHRGALVVNRTRGRALFT